MKWFEGSINEAVATSKSRKAIFVVFIEGKDDASAEAAKAIDGTEVSRRLEREEFVAIRLESGSETYRFFAQIYQLVPVPSLFFIGENGAPLEIIAGSTTETDLTTKIDLVLSKAGKSADSSQNLINAEQKATTISNTAPSSNTVDENKKNETTIVSEEPLPQTASTNESNNMAANNIIDEQSTNSETTESLAPMNEAKDASTTELTAEEKLERARQLIEQQRKQRMEEEEQKAREREIERRKDGRNIQKMRQKQQDQEMRQAYEEKMREKAADAAAREKVLQQILQDKLERKQKSLIVQQQVPQQQNAESIETVKPSASATTISRIQFRLPSGNPYIAQFEPTSTLRDLRSYVVENINLPFRQFAMSISFPRQELTHEDDDKTLLELQLVPTAVILILPLTNPNATTTVISTQGAGLISRVLWSTFAVFSAVYYYVGGYFTGGRRNDTPKRQTTPTENTEAGSSTEETLTSNVQNSASTSGLGRRYLGNRGSTIIKTEGNIHRLHSGGDDNDDNNTWNGNSTQQM